MHVVARALSRPEVWTPVVEVCVEGFVDAALLGRLSVSREEVLECVPRDEDEDHL